VSKKYLIISVIVGIISVLLYIFYSNSLQQQKQNLPSANLSENETEQNIPKMSVVAEDLEIPWSLVFLPDNKILFTERAGRLRIIDSDGSLNPDSILINETLHQGEGGLMGLEIHPNFSENNYIYFYYTYSSNDNNTFNRVVRFKFTDNALSERKIIVDNIPGNFFHNGGRIKFGPDGYLYITTGDSQNPSLSQNTDSLAGKILKVDEDGNIPSDNPFGNQVYSYGNRNPQGITWDMDGNFWSTEHGRSGALAGFDEINLIEKGKNYGWPEAQGDDTKPGMTKPVLHSTADVTWAPAGAVYLNNSIFFAGLRGQTLYEAVLDRKNIIELKEHFKGEFGRIRDVIKGSDNMLYIATSNRDGRGQPNTTDDKILRINPDKL
jgi:aldose sugar dehydrogenase